MTDHDAIAAHARRCPATDPDAAGAAAYLDLYDEVQRLRAERDDWMSARNDAVRERVAAEAERDALISLRDCPGNFWAKAEARAEKAEAERIAEWNKRRDAESSLVLEKAVCLTAEAERDRLRAVLNEIATAASGIAHDIQIGPEDEGRDIYEMALAIRDDAREALKGNSDA